MTIEQRSTRAPADTGALVRRLSAGDGPAVLVADFQALSAAPRLSQLMTDVATGQRIHQVDPRGALSGDRLYAAVPELADETVALFGADESGTSAADQRVFVVGHCSSTGLAVRVANSLAGTADVTAVLVEPTWPDTAHVAACFAEFQGKLGGGDRACPDLDVDPWSCVAGMDQLMTEDLAAMATRLGLKTAPPAFTELRVSYRTWLAFLLACRNDQPAVVPGDGVAVSVLSDEPGFVLPGTTAGRCRIAPLPPGLEPAAVTPELAGLVLDQIISR